MLSLCSVYNHLMSCCVCYLRMSLLYVQRERVFHGIHHVGPKPPRNSAGFCATCPEIPFPVSHIQVGGRLNMNLAVRLAEVSGAHRTQKQ